MSLSNSNVKEKGNKVINGLIKFQKIFSVIMIILMLSLVFFQVILRSLNLPLMGIEELLILPTIWLYMIGAANASQERSHISVDIIEVFLKNKKLLIILSIIKNIVSLFIGIILTYWMFIHFSYSLSMWKLSPLLSMPLFLVESALFVGVFLMTLYTFMDTIRSIKYRGDYPINSNREGGVQ